MARFREVGGTWLKSFEPDFGRSIVHQFRIDNSNSTNNLELENWNLYPNPTRDKFTISGKMNEAANIEIANYLGKVVKVLDLNERGIFVKEINLEGLSSGIYFIKISNSKGDIIKKIVKQ